MAVGPGNVDVTGHECPKCGDKPVGERRKMRVKVGDVIFHSQFSGSEITIEGEKYLIMHGEREEVDVYGIFTGESPIDIQPFEDRVLLEWEQGRSEYLGSKILTAHQTQERYYTGIVRAIGPDVLDITVGQRVFFNQFSRPEKIEYMGKRYAFIYERDIFCLIPTREEIEMSVLSS